MCEKGRGTVRWRGKTGRSPFRQSRKPCAKRMEPAGGGRAAPRSCGKQKCAGAILTPGAEGPIIME